MSHLPLDGLVECLHGGLLGERDEVGDQRLEELLLAQHLLLHLTALSEQPDDLVVDVARGGALFRGADHPPEQLLVVDEVGQGLVGVDGLLLVVVVVGYIGACRDVGAVIDDDMADFLRFAVNGSPFASS